MRLQAHQWCWLIAACALAMAILSGVSHWGWGWVMFESFYAGEMWREGWASLPGKRR